MILLTVIENILFLTKIQEVKKRILQTQKSEVRRGEEVETGFYDTKIVLNLSKQQLSGIFYSKILIFWYNILK